MTISPALLRIVRVTCLALLFGVLAYLSATYTRDQHRIAAIWLPNAVLVAALLRRDRADPVQIAAACCSNIVANLAAGDELARAIALSLVNSVEIAIIYFGMRRQGLARPDMLRFDHLLAFVIVGGLIGPAASGLLAAVILGGLGMPAVDLWLSWTLTDALGLLIVAPAIWVTIDAWQKRARPTRRQMIEWLAIMGGGLVVVASLFLQSRFPLLFVATPVVFLAASRLGGPGAAAATLLVAIVASAGTALGTGPIALVDGTLSDRLHVLQAFLAVNFAMSLPVAAVLESRAAAVHALADSEMRNRSILDNMREIIFQTDVTGRWTFLNPAWERLTGYPVAASLGWDTTRLLHPEDRDAARSVYPKLVSGTVNEATLRQRFFRRDGECRHIEVSVRRLSDHGGGFRGTSGNIRDVTEMVLQQHALEESEARFRRMAEAAPVGIFRADAKGQINYVNAAWCAKIGLTLEQSLGDGWMAALADTAPYAADPPWQGMHQPGDIKRRIARFRGADGKNLWVETVNSAEFDEQGRITGYIGVVIDITELRAANQALAEREAELRLLADNATDAIVRLNLDGICLYASPSAKDLFELPTELMIGQNLIADFHPDDDADVRNMFADLGAGRKDSALIAFRSAAPFDRDRYRWMEANCALLRDPASNSPKEIIASIRDVSSTKALEGKLRHARERAEQAAVAKSAFLANMSHEIRTPMNGVIGFTELLQASKLDAGQRQQVDMIADSGRAMMRLLNDILDISKVEAGQMEIASEPVDLRHVLSGVVRLMEPSAFTKGLDLQSHVAEGVPALALGDPLRLRQVLLNLVGNAIKFTEQGHVRIAMSAEETGTETLLHIKVEDSGIGIAPERRDSIFDNFAQADTSIARRFGGTGLGLSITRQLVELMGGTIEVSSDHGVGSTFFVRLPLRVAASEHRDKGDVPSVASSTRPLAPPRILIAEDNEINQALMRSMAEKLGYAFRIAPDGGTAVAAVEASFARNEPFDLVLMDVQMPGMDGLEATRRLRDLGFDAKKLPIVALTANAYADDIAACREAGMQHHLAKPMSLALLSETVLRFLPTEAWSIASPAVEATPREDIPPALHAQFQQRVSETLSLCAELKNDEAATNDDWLRLMDMLHRLAGTAGFFGNDALGTWAAELEHQLASHPLAERKTALMVALASLGSEQNPLTGIGGGS